MGIKGAKQTRTETPETLRQFAVRLESIAKGLDDIAERMLLCGVRSIDVRNSPGAHSAFFESIEPFYEDAKKKGRRKAGDDKWESVRRRK